MPANYGMSRRRVLSLAGLGAAGAVLAACSKPAAPAGAGPTSPGASGSSGPSTSPSPSDGLIRGSGSPVHTRLLQGDG